MERGTIISFNRETGCGVIKSLRGEKTFFHYSNLKNESFKTLHEGKQVYFDFTKILNEAIPMNIRLR